MGGKPVFTREAKAVINFESAFEHKLLCDGPTFSLGDACNYSCTFCYVPDLIRKLRTTAVMAGVEGKHEEIVIRRENAIAILRGQLVDGKGRARFLAEADRTYRANRTDRTDNQNKLFGRAVIYSSPLVDCAGNMELVRETVEACKVILELTNWDIRLLSKSNLLPKVAEGLEGWKESAGIQRTPNASRGSARERVIYGVSTGTLDDGLARAIEQGTPLVSKRLASLHWLQDRGYRTFGMVCPSLPHRDHKEFVGQMAAAIRAERCEHVWAEVINLRGESFTRTVAALSEAEFHWEAETLRSIADCKPLWETYARKTFEAWAELNGKWQMANGKPKLRFLQYVAPATRSWWESQAKRGAVVL